MWPLKSNRDDKVVHNLLASLQYILFYCRVRRGVSPKRRLQFVGEAVLILRLFIAVNVCSAPQYLAFQRTGEPRGECYTLLSHFEILTIVYY